MRSVLDFSSTSNGNAVRITAFGDLMLTGEWSEIEGEDRAAEAFSGLREFVGQDDLVFANLETTLEGSDGYISKEPRVLGKASAVRNALTTLGVDVINLANNHSFDCYVSGFDAVRMLLEQDRIQFFGAGRDAEEAGRPCVVERQGIRLGWLGYVAFDTKPSHVAGPDRFGVNPLVPEKALADVERLKQRVDHVIVSLHWGIEYCHAPGPAQVEIGRALVRRGASLVIGHHAHVIQGVEVYRGSVIAYGLGNLTTTDFHVGGRLAIKQTRRTRSSLVVRATLGKTGVRDFEVVPIRSIGYRILVNDAYARRIAARANRILPASVSRVRWKAHRLLEDVILRPLWKLDPRVVRSIRPEHAVKLIRNIAGRGPA